MVFAYPTSYFTVGASFDNRNETYKDGRYITGYVVRFAYNPSFDISYGFRSQEIAGSLTEVITNVIKFPLPLFKKLILTVGTQDTSVKDDDDEIVAQSTSYSLSAEMEFGDPVRGPGRRSNMVPGRSVAPKTKRLEEYIEF